MRNRFGTAGRILPTDGQPSFRNVPLSMSRLGGVCWSICRSGNRFGTAGRCCGHDYWWGRRNSLEWPLEALRFPRRVPRTLQVQTISEVQTRSGNREKTKWNLMEFVWWSGKKITEKTFSLQTKKNEDEARKKCRKIFEKSRLISKNPHVIKL